MIHYIKFLLLATSGLLPIILTAANPVDRASSVIFVAHRGGILPGVPENTLAAFKQAIAFGVDAIEIDLRGTKDGEIVILHDATLNRTTNGSGNAADYPLEALKRLDAGHGERIPTFPEVLHLIAGTRVKLLLDIKVSPVLNKRQVVRLTEQHGAVLDVILGVRNLADLLEFRQLNPNLRTLGFAGTPEEIVNFIAAGVDIIRVWPEWIKNDPGLIAKIHQLGKPVWVTTANAPRAEILELIQLGIDGILSDWPDFMEILRPPGIK